jgi:hypothetical protein
MMTQVEKVKLIAKTLKEYLMIGEGQAVEIAYKILERLDRNES